MRSPLLLSGPNIRKAYFEASNRRMLFHRPPLKSDLKSWLCCNIFGFEASKYALRFFGKDKIDGLLI